MLVKNHRQYARRSESEDTKRIAAICKRVAVDTQNGIFKAMCYRC